MRNWQQKLKSARVAKVVAAGKREDPPPEPPRRKAVPLRRVKFVPPAENPSPAKPRVGKAPARQLGTALVDPDSVELVHTASGAWFSPTKVGQAPKMPSPRGLARLFGTKRRRMTWDVTDQKSVTGTVCFPFSRYLCSAQQIPVHFPLFLLAGGPRRR